MLSIQKVKIITDNKAKLRYSKDIDDPKVFDYLYSLSDYITICTILNNHQDNITGGMLLDQENFDWVKQEYGIKEVQCINGLNMHTRQV